MDPAGCYRPSYDTDTYVNVLPYGMSRQSLAMGNAKRIQVLRARGFPLKVGAGFACV